MFKFVCRVEKNGEDPQRHWKNRTCRRTFTFLSTHTHIPSKTNIYIYKYMVHTVGDVPFFLWPKLDSIRFGLECELWRWGAAVGRGRQILHTNVFLKCNYMHFFIAERVADSHSHSHSRKLIHVHIVFIFCHRMPAAFKWVRQFIAVD